MPKRVRPKPTLRSRCAGWLLALWSWMACSMSRAWQVACRACRRQDIAIEVLSTDQQRRRSLERELRVAMRRLRRTLGAPPLDGLAIIAQHVLGTSRQLAGCTHLSQGADGATRALIRLALEVDGRALGADEVLAALAEQWIGLISQRTHGATVIVPVEFAPPQPQDAGQTSEEPPSRPVPVPGAHSSSPGLSAAPTPLRPDPLAPIPFRAPEGNGLPS